MRVWVRPGTELVLAFVALVFAATCARAGTTTAPYRAVAEGAPPFEVTTYSGSWIAGAAALVAVAGVLIVDALRLSFENRRSLSGNGCQSDGVGARPVEHGRGE